MIRQKITLALRSDGTVAACEPPQEDGATFVVVRGLLCPCCGALPFRVAGSRPQPSTDDQAIVASAACLDCLARVGTLRVEMETLFGVREDAAVLEGRARVYGGE